MKLNKSGQINIPLLALLAIIGVIAFLLVTQSFNFKNPILGSLYNKTPSQAFENVEVHSEDKTPTSLWSENWDSSPYLSRWTQKSFNCSVAPQESRLNLNCTSGTLESKTKLSNHSSVIVTGSFLAQENSTASLGLSNAGNLAQISTGPISGNDFQIPNYQPGTYQNFRLVSSLINNERFVFYYLGDASEPVKKGPISNAEDLKVSITCQGSCTFGPLSISGIPQN